MINNSMGKRVALIYPGKDTRFDVHEPLNLGVMAAILENNGIEVKIIDELSGDNVSAQLDKFRPDIAGITATTPFALRAYEHAATCRKMGIITVMGGVHASIMSEEALGFVDVVVKGEGEQALLDIVSGKARDRLVSCAYTPDLDTLPPPAYHLFNMDFYLHTRDRTPYDTSVFFIPPGYKVVSMLTSRGCPFSCTFCHNSWKGMPFRFQSAQRVVEDIKFLISTYHVKAVTFFDDNFFANRQRVKEICQRIIAEKIKVIWGCNARADSIDADSLRLARLAGCRQIAFGFESGSQKILDTINKKTKVEQNIRAVQLCREAKLLCVGYFMLGNPHETREDVELTRRFILENDIDCMGLSISTPFPGTELWKWCEEKDYLPKEFKWSDFAPDNSPIRVDEFLSVEEIKKLRSKLYFDFSLKPKSFIRFLRMSIQQPFKSAKKAGLIFKGFSIFPASKPQK